MMNKKGLTLLEGLISLGIITFGLLSLAALFVDGARNMREAEIQERSRIVAEEAFNDIIAYRMLDTPKWIMYNEDEGMFNQSLVETMQYLHMTDQKHKMEEVVGSVFVLDPIGAASVNYNGQARFVVECTEPSTCGLLQIFRESQLRCESTKQM